VSRSGRGIGAFSGGLDGLLAARLLAGQGIDVLLVTFSSPFFGAETGRAGAEQLGLPWREADFTPEIMGLLGGAPSESDSCPGEPPSGFGSCLNPCIDCHAAMIAKLGCIMREEGYDFVFTGEVLGQRPMSQSPPSLNRVANLSGLGGRLLRPLSALLLPPSTPETEGLVDRSRLLGLNGRGRKPQIALAKEWGLSYPPPAGGCLLTDQIYCKRLGALRDAKLLSPLNARLIRHGRLFRLGPASFLVLGRDERDNAKLEELSGGAVYTPRDVPGPSAVPVGDPSPQLEAAALVALFSRPVGSGYFCVNTPDGSVIETPPASRETAESTVIR
jgi:hypothetical protein